MAEVVIKEVKDVVRVVCIGKDFRMDALIEQAQEVAVSQQWVISWCYYMIDSWQKLDEKHIKITSMFFLNLTEQF